MKKIITILFIIVILVMGTISVKATDETTKNIELDIKGQTTLKEGVKKVEIYLSLGDFIGISENIVLGYQTKLEYDTTIFESVVVEGMNGWTATYSSETNNLIGDTQNAKANTDITKIIVTVKNEIKPGASGTIKLKNILLTDGTNDFSYNKEITVKIEGEQENNPNNETNTNTNTNNNTNQNTTNSTNNTTNNVGNNTVNNIVNNSISKNNINIDNTKANSKLPATGLKSIIILAVFTIAISAIIFKIKSKDIKY